MSLGLRKFFFSIFVAALASLLVLLQEKSPETTFPPKGPTSQLREDPQEEKLFQDFFPLGELRGMLQQQQKYFRKFFSAPQTFFSVRNIFIEAIS